MPSSGQVWFVKVITDLCLPPEPNLFLNISSYYVRIKLHAENQLPSLLNSGYSLKLGFGTRTQQHFQFFLSIFLLWLESSFIPKISLLACLILEMAMKRTLKLGFGRWPQQHFQFFLIFLLVKIKLHTKNQLPSLLNSEDVYEEDLKIRIWKITSI